MVEWVQMEELIYSLREAARRAGVPDERLRRAILMGDLLAEPVPDGREYLIQALHLRPFFTVAEPASSPFPPVPARRRKLAFWVVLLGFLLLVGLVLLGFFLKGGEFSSLPRIWNGKYKAAPYVRAAARLQEMGREAACQKLLRAAQTYNQEQEEQIIVLCRMLFTKRATSEFRRPMIGAASFFGSTDYADWPLEPIELVDGVPFLITRGYLLKGEAEPAESYLRHCMTNCDWSTVPFREPTAKQIRDALDKLLASGKWKRPLDTYEREFLSAQIE